MGLIDWLDEIKRLYFEGYSLDEAILKIKKMMKEQKRRELNEEYRNGII